MSNIASVYAAIAAWTPTGAGAGHNILAGSGQLTIANADLPKRILLPSTNVNGEFVMIGTLQKTAWSIRDLCLWAPLGSGSGVEQYSSAMLTYIASYLAKVKAARSPAANCAITGVEAQMGPVPWGEKDYWAVDITVTVEEHI